MERSQTLSSAMILFRLLIIALFIIYARILTKHSKLTGSSTTQSFAVLIPILRFSFSFLI